MGNSPSKSPPGNPHAPSAGPPHNASGQERKVNRRTSINALSSTKASAADPSASKESATGQSASHGVATVQQRLQSRNIPNATQNIYEGPDRSNSKRSDSRYQAGAAVEASSPVQVPSATNRSIPRRDEGYMPAASSANPSNTYYSASHLQRPPRLPLPIGDANATPGSPVIAPVDSQVDSESFEPLDNKLPTATISLDDTHVDEDEVEDEMLAYAMHGPGSKAVPTVIEWGGRGDQVFVTGTFVNWEKKFRLHKSETNPNIKTTILHLRPGTHHLKFIVDGDMRASDNLPTAVDFTNHLVNYIEVVADEFQGQKSRRESQRAIKAMVPAGVHPSQVLPDKVAAQQAQEALEREAEEPEEEIPMGNFRHTVPQFLVDIDREDEGAEYQRAANVIADAATPPILPLFLGRSILNGTTPMKDDNSVLNYPNHTVLNHLATSSIKNGVLATSVTTRYKRKYVTTIMYKPTGDGV